MITDESTYYPAMYMNAGNGFVNAASSYYWSSTTAASETSTAWDVYFFSGYNYWNSKSGSDYV